MRHRIDNGNPSYTLCGQWQSDPEMMAPLGETVWYDLDALDQEACRLCYHSQEAKRLEEALNEVRIEIQALRDDPQEPQYWQDEVGRHKEALAEIRLEAAREAQLQEDAAQELKNEVGELKENLATVTLALGVLTSGGDRKVLLRLQAIHHQQLSVDPEILDIDPALKPYFNFIVDPVEEPALEPELRTAWDRVRGDD